MPNVARSNLSARVSLSARIPPIGINPTLKKDYNSHDCEHSNTLWVLSKSSAEQNTCDWQWMEWSTCSSFCNLDGTMPEDAPTTKKREKTDRLIKVPQELCQGAAEENCPKTPCTSKLKFALYTLSLHNVINSWITIQSRFCLELGPCCPVVRAPTATTLAEVTATTSRRGHALLPVLTYLGDTPAKPLMGHLPWIQVKQLVNRMYPVKVTWMLF